MKLFKSTRKNLNNLINLKVFQQKRGKIKMMKMMMRMIKNKKIVNNRKKKKKNLIYLMMMKYKLFLNKDF
jgi:hypothetical protein